MATKKKNNPTKIIKNEVDYWRQLDIFSPDNFKTPITVIGAGATGSYIVWLLAKMGCKDITVYDFDIVEDHNVPNQIFGPDAIGELKVEVLREKVEQGTGITIKAIPKKFKKEKLRGIVFVLTDSMKSRKSIWLSSIKYQLDVDLLIETRMGAEEGWIYAIRPCDPKEVDGYEKTLYSDEEAEESACSNRAIASTVAVIAGIAVSDMLNFVNNKDYPQEAYIALSPFLIMSQKFK